MKKKNNQRLLLSVGLVLSLVLAGCSSSGSSSSSAAATEVSPQSAQFSLRDAGEMAGADTYYEYDVASDDYDYYDAEEEFYANPSAGGGVGEAAAPVVTQRKIVTTYYLTLETTDYDEAVKHLSSSADGLGGYVERSSVGGRSIHNEYAARYASFTLRIPSDQVGEFLGGLDERYNVINSEESSDDITDSYYDVAARLASLEEQRDRLIALREENAEGADLQYLLQIEQEISYVNYQIESFYSSLQRMDQSVNLSTLYIELREVVTYQPVEPLPQSFGERFSAALSNSWKNFVRASQDAVISIIIAAPFLIVNLFWFAVFAVIILLIVRFVRKRMRRKNTPVAEVRDSAVEESEAEEPDSKE